MTDPSGNTEPERQIITAAELAALHESDIIPDPDAIDCNAVHAQLEASAKQYKDAGSHQTSAVMLLYSITGIHDKFDDPAEPYGPMLVMDGKRSMIPSDLRGQQTAELAIYAPRIQNPTLRARIADIVWINDKSRRDIADLAIEAYVLRVEQYLDGSAKFRHDMRSLVDHRVFELLRRAFQISNAVKGTNEHPARLTSCLACVQEKAFGGADLPSIARLAQLSLDFSAVEEEGFGVRIDEVVSQAGTSDPYWKKFVLEQLRRLYRRNGQEDKANDCQLLIAECSVQQADAMSGSSMASASWLMTAIDELRQARGPIAKARATELRKLLREKQEESVFEMGSFSQSTDITELVTETLEQFDDLSLGEALGQFASLHRSPDPEQLLEQAKKTAAEHPLSSMFAATHVDREGKTVAKGEGSNFADLSNSDSLRDTVIQDSRFMRNLVVSSAIEPARRRIQAELQPTHHAFDVITTNSAFIPAHHKALFSLGFARFFQGDMMSAGSLLLPQLENSLRYVLKAAGQDPSTIESDLTQDDRSISALMAHERAALDEILGADIAFEIDILFNVRPGPALRHEVAHGKIPSAHFYSEDVNYACWLIFRITCLPLFPHWNQIREMIDQSES